MVEVGMTYSPSLSLNISHDAYGLHTPLVLPPHQGPHEAGPPPRSHGVDCFQRSVAILLGQAPHQLEGGGLLDLHPLVPAVLVTDPVAQLLQPFEGLLLGVIP